MLDGYNVNAVASVATMAAGAIAVVDSASVSAVAGLQVQILGFDATASGVPYTVKLKYGDSVASSYRKSADSDLERTFNVWGPVAGNNTSVDLEVTPDVQTDIGANLYYRMIK